MRFISAINIIFINVVYTCGWEVEENKIPTWDLGSRKLYSAVEDENVNPKLTGNLSQHFLKQPLDHFDPKENRTFDMLYYKWLTHNWKPNAPIYLMLTYTGDRKFVSWQSLATILAKATNGSSFTTAPRYYGYSITMNLTHDKDYFKFLNTTQQLADIAGFIRHIKSQDGFRSSKVVILGFSFYWGDRWATWMRLKYPDLVDAAVVTGATLLAKKDFKDFLPDIASSYEKFGPPGCVNKITNFYNWIGEMLKNTTGIEILKQYFPSTCGYDNFTMKIDKEAFMMNRYWILIMGAMGGPSEIEYACKHEITPEEMGPAFVTPPSNCIEYHIDNLIPIAWSIPWYYQTCTEYGQFRTTTSEKPPFVQWNPLDYYLQFCKTLFGIDEKRIDDGIAETNRMFGGNTPNLTNVVFTYGYTDPSRLLGVPKNRSDSVLSFIVEGDAVNVQFYASGESEDTKETRERVMSIIKRWIAP